MFLLNSCVSKVSKTVTNVLLKMFGSQAIWIEKLIFSQILEYCQYPLFWLLTWGGPVGHIIMWYNAPSYILERVVFQVYTVHTVEMTSPPEVYWQCIIEVRHYLAYKHFVLMILISYFKKLYAQDYTELRMKLVLSFKKIGAEYCQ